MSESSLVRHFDGPPPDLDRWLKDLYHAHRDGGTAGFAAQLGVQLSVQCFTVACSTMLVGFVDWGGLYRECADAPCRAADHFRGWQSDLRGVAMGLYVAGCAAYLIWRAIRGAARVRRMTRISAFLRRYLPDVDLATTEWCLVVRRLIALQNEEGLRIQCNTPTFTAVHVAMRVLRRENFMVALTNAGIIDVGTMPPIVVWHLWRVVLASGYDPKHPQRFRLVAATMRRDAQRWCLLNLAVMPVTVVLVAAGLLLRAAEGTTARDPSRPVSARRWSNDALWRMRHYNEYRHQLNARAARGRVYAQRLIDAEPAPRRAAAARGLQFVCGSLAGCAAALAAVHDDAATHVHVAGRSLLWWLAFWSAGFAMARLCDAPVACRSATTERDLAALAAHTQYVPDVAGGGVAATVAAIYPLVGVDWVMALWGVVSMPRRLWGWSQQADVVAAFFKDATEEDTPLGDVCRYSNMSRATTLGVSKASRSQRSFYEHYDDAWEDGSKCLTSPLTQVESDR